MESQNDIIQKFIEQNVSKIQFSDGKFYSTYIPQTNPISSLSSFAKNRGNKNSKELIEDLFYILSNKTLPIEKRKIAQEIVNQIQEVFQSEYIQSIKNQKKAEEKEIEKENSKRVRWEIKEEDKKHTEELAIREESKENKEQRDKKDAFKKRLVNVGIMGKNHIDTIIEALLQDNEILETFIDTKAAENLRKSANYGNIRKEIQNPKIQNIVERFKWKIKDETAEIPNIEKIKIKQKTSEPEIDVEYNNGNIITTIDEKTYETCKYNEKKAKFLLKEEKFEIRSWLLWRIIEYIQMDIIKEKVHPYIASDLDFSIRKTDIVDDTMTGIDFILTFEKREKNEKGKEIKTTRQCYIDWTTALNDETLFKKSEEAKKAKIPYNYTIERARELSKTKKKNRNLIFPEAEKYVEKSEEYTTPYIISKALEYIEKWESYDWFIKEFFNIDKNKITDQLIDFQAHLPANQKYRSGDIALQAKRIDIKKIEEVSIEV